VCLEAHRHVIDPLGRRTPPASGQGGTDGASPLLEQALTGLVQDDHWRLLVIQSAPIDVLDAQIEALRTEMSRCLMELDADEPLAKAA
jgi:hypothetical protein